MTNRVLREVTVGPAQVQLVQGDITEEQVDAIVNAANKYLEHGGGLARVIVKKGGSVIQEESHRWVRTHGPVRHEEPAYTTAGALPARYVIHAVGPVWGEGDEDAKLAVAVQGSLRRAEELGCTSIALPAISTGIFGFPKDRAAHVIFRAVRDYLRDAPTTPLRQVRIVVYDAPTVEAFREAWDTFPWNAEASA